MDNIASALSGANHITAIGRAAGAELAEVPTNGLLMYLVDSAPESALYHLADQFGVLGWAGWRLAATVAARRALIKKAIVLHRKKGTVFAIKEAVRAVGFDSAEIREGVGVDYDGTYVYDGSITYAGGNWATFRVTVAVGADVSITPELAANMRALIEEYKNARSHLIDVSFAISLADTLSPSEILEYDDGQIVDQLFPGVDYSGEAFYNGAQTYNNGADIVNLRVYRNGTLIENGYY